MLDGISRHVVVLLFCLAALTVGRLVGTGETQPPVRECGNLQASGPGVYNVTSRVIRCRTARRLARDLDSNFGDHCSNSGRCRYRAWECLFRASAERWIDIRCTRSRGRVFRYQSYN